MTAGAARARGQGDREAHDGPPPVALTCGEPAGIGPEVAAKAWSALRGDLPFFFLGDPAHLPPGTPMRLIDDPAEAAEACAEALPVLPHRFPEPAQPGAPSPANAPFVIEVIERAVDLVQAGRAAALCTAPIHKAALQEGAGFAHPGHTEFLAHLSGAPRPVMMLASERLRVVPATIHIPLEEVPRALTPDLLEEVIRITAAGLRQNFGLVAPRIVVAGLNPHAGEDGHIGRQEVDWIGPLVARLADQGLNLSGPHSADTLFHPAARARYDAAICMYHDQALIPIKTLDFDAGVNVTLGLPFVRTSPDHGTAFDIAGTGVASPTSTIEALKLAARMADAGARSAARSEAP